MNALQEKPEKTQVSDPSAGALAKFASHRTEIELFKARFAAVKFDGSAEQYEEGRQAIAQLRKTRTWIEERRVELKADALAWGRRVDEVAKQLTAFVESIECPLKEAKKLVDDAKAREKFERENAERLRLEAESKARIAAEEEAAKKRAAEEAERLRVENARLAEERRKLDEERQRIAQEQARREQEARAAAAERERQDAAARAEREAAEAKARQEREALEAQVRELERQRAEDARREAERIAAEKAAKEAEERAAREAAEAEERAKAEAARIERMRPDVEKVRLYGERLQELVFAAPELDDLEAAQRFAGDLEELQGIADRLKSFGANGC